MDKDIFDLTSSQLSEEVKSLLFELFEDDIYYEKIRRVGENVEIDIENGDTFACTITLLNVSYMTDITEEFEYILLESGSFDKERNEYTLSGEVIGYDDEDVKEFIVRFTDVKVDTKIYRVEGQFLCETPWQYLQQMACEIINRYLISDEYINKKEEEIIPLLIEISKISSEIDMYDELEIKSCIHLKNLASKLGYEELMPIFNEYEKELSKGGKKDRARRKLISKLNMIRYESLWRKIYNIIMDTQKEYPSKVYTDCTPELLHKTRERIQEIMESYGYIGKYPDFKKKGSIKGIHVVDSYDVAYFLGLEKNVVYHIHCNEDYYDEQLTIQLVSGTEVLKKDEQEGDIYSCFFNAKGKRLIHTVQYDCSNSDSNEECEVNTLEQCVRVAIKRAELKKLTKKERKQIQDVDFIYLRLFGFIFIVMGGLFAIALTLGMILLGIVACLVVAQPDKIYEVIGEIPW